jgi:hypothetical protein
MDFRKDMICLFDGISGNYVDYLWVNGMEICYLEIEKQMERRHCVGNEGNR